MHTFRLANRAAARSVRHIKHGQLLGSRAIANTAARSLGVHAPAVLRSQASLLSTARSVDHSDQEWTASAASPPFDPSDEATIQAWTERFLDAVRDVPAATDPARSAAVLRELVKSNLLSFTDMRDAPEKFFLAHRLLATVGLGGFGVRFTVQFNLFAGSIVGLGGPEQVASLREITRDFTRSLAITRAGGEPARHPGGGPAGLLPADRGAGGRAVWTDRRDYLRVGRGHARGAP